MTTQIRRKVRHLVCKYNTRNPYEIAEAIGARIYFDDLGDVAGFYQYIKRHRCIYINSTLDDRTARIVMAHELGHAIMHRKENCYFIEDQTLFFTSRIEREANRFAAELLIPDDLIYQYEGFSCRQIAYAEGLNEELLRLKFEKY